MEETKKPTSRTVASAKKDNEIIIKISNSYIKVGETYEISSKRDGTAPDGMQDKETTKFLNEGNKEIRSIYYDESRRAWDTGFYPESMCLVNMLNEDESYKQAYIKHIKIPYEKAFNVDCSQTNNEFWDNYRYEIKVNKSFKTSDPKDLFDLFHALAQGRVCEVGEKDPILQKANYTIRNLEAVKSVEDSRLEDKFEATSTFMVLLNTDKEKLYSVLEWIQLSEVRTMDDKVIKSTFLRSFDHPKTGYDFSRRFLEGLKMYDTDNGKKQMEYFIICQKLLTKNKVERKLGVLYYDGLMLGNSVKEVSLKALTNTEISDKLVQGLKAHLTK